MTDESAQSPTQADGQAMIEQMMASHQKVRDSLGLGGSGPLSIEEMIEGQTAEAKTAIVDTIRDLSGAREGTGWEYYWWKGGQTHKRDLPSFAFHTITSGCWDEATARDLALDAWGLPEWPGQIGREEWDEIFHAVGGLPLIADDDDMPVPDEHVRVWRGAYEDHYAGLSWTTDPETAKWFAARANRPGEPDKRAQVWTTTVTPARVYAYLNGRGEHEVVCAVEGLPVTLDPEHAVPANATAYGPGKGQFWVACGCGDRHYGHRGAAGLLLRHTPDGGAPQVWLARRGSGTDQAGKWAFPSGAREPDESPMATALREFAEETGFDAGRLPEPTHVLDDDHGDWSFTTIVIDVDEDTALAVDRSTRGDGESVDGAWWTIDEAHHLPLLAPVADLLLDLHPNERKP